MKKHLTLTLDLLKRALFSDRTNFYFIISTIIIFGLNILIWNLKFKDYAATFGWKLPFSPLAYCSIIAVINLLLALVTFNNEKEVSHLLLAAITLIVFLVFILEVFCLTNLA